MGRLKKPSTLSTPPSFFKILLGDFTKQIRIPPAFIKNFCGKFIDQFILKCYDGKAWVVKVREDVGNLFLHSGWECFVKDNSLELGDFLVFNYDGELTFQVEIFDKSGCEKLGCVFDEEVKEKDKIVKARQVPFCPCKYSCKSATCRNTSGDVKLKETAFEMKAKLKFNAVGCPLKLKHPHFTARWRPRKPYTVLIPKFFMRKLKLTKKQSWLFRDPSWKKWPVNISHSCNRRDFGSGWNGFRISNKIKEGDTCV